MHSGAPVGTIGVRKLISVHAAGFLLWGRALNLALEAGALRRGSALRDASGTPLHLVTSARVMLAAHL